MSRGLHMRFEDPAGFQAEYERNIKKGGAFVPSSARWELRAVVTVELELAWCGESIALGAEIVHCTPAGTDPRQAGVAVQFLDPIESLRERLSPIAAAAAGTPPLGPPEMTAPAPEPDATTMPRVEPAVMPPSPDASAPALELDVLEDDLTLDLDDATPKPTPDGGSPRPELEDATPPATLELDDTTNPQLELDVTMPAELALDDAVVDGDDPDPLSSTLTLDTPLAETHPRSDAVESPPLELAPEPAAEPGRPELETTQEALTELEVDRSGLPTTGGEALGRDLSLDLHDPLEGVDERRTAERQTARVPIRVDASHISLDGRTRDISENGVLLSTDGNDLPLGKKVTLSLTHPNTGERLTIEGTVARHVEAQGTVAAVGIAFDARIEEDMHLRDFIRQVQAAESERRQAGITGIIEELGTPNLLQMFGQSSEHGTLTLCSGVEEAAVAFERGQLRYVRLGSLRGVKALSRLLGWEYGTFEYVSQVDDVPGEEELIPLDAALLEATRQLDEAAREESDGVDLGMTLRLDRGALRTLDATLTQTEQSVLDLAAAALTLRRLLDVIPEPDAQILAAFHSLRERGVVDLVPTV